MSKPLVLVVAAALVDPQGRLLLAERPAGKSMAGLWEFPGGKVEPGERPEQSLVRELREELGLIVEEGSLEPFHFASHDYEKFHLLMPLYVCWRWAGEVSPQEGQRHAWVGVAELDDYPVPPADEPLMPRMRALLAAHAGS
ncbi:MAG: 8-oxo-dGTP diphosphatase MutT [Alphaproteobacteria bacterium]|nr:8-oxo-dGTP diphosphatase MutT [Alphaproteobacteria bacterium]